MEMKSKAEIFEEWGVEVLLLMVIFLRSKSACVRLFGGPLAM